MEVRFDRKRSWKEWNWMIRMEMEAKKKRDKKRDKQTNKRQRKW